MQSGLSIVIPVFNSQNTLAELAQRLQEALTRSGALFEVLLVNDGSRDSSWIQIQELAKKYSWIKGVSLMRNYGQHNALLCGIRQASFDTIVTLDDDLQNPPQEISKLLTKFSEGYEVVYGVPQKQEHEFWRRLGSKITELTLRGAMGSQVASKVTSFRVFKTDLREAFSNYNSPFVSLDVLLTWGSTKFSTVIVQHDERHEGVSNYTLRKLVVHAFNMMTGFSVLPLQIASLVGFLSTLMGVILLAIVLIGHFSAGERIPGFPFLASIICVFSGTQLFALGIIGEYLARMHFRVMDRPAYAVRSTTT